LRRAWALIVLLAPGCEATFNLRYDHEVQPGQVVSAVAEIKRLEKK
jgi:hypothetical protein